jgi:tetratricopeptide (TPR) repeat protein
LEKAESLLAKSPSNVVAHQMLAVAAIALGLLKTAAFAYETVKRIQPKDLANLKSLANIYIETGQTEKAIETGNLIVSINPRDGDAEDIMKRASVAAAMHRGKWEESEDFRTQLKDEAEAQALEQASKTMTDAKGLEGLIRQAYDKVQLEPNNINHYKQLSDYYQRYGDLENAIAWIQQARTQEAGKGDVSLEEKERSLTLEYYDQSIEQWEKACAQDPQNHEWAQSLKTANLTKKQYQFSQLESLVQRYPNDYGYRYELGLILFEDEKFDDCLQHFQLAQRNAKVRLDAILYLGRSYSRKGFYDMAIEQFSILKNEIQVMDDRKKDATYELGCCLESMGNKDKAFEEFKAVYSADISFRDVADKINSFYQNKTAS